MKSITLIFFYFFSSFIFTVYADTLVEKTVMKLSVREKPFTQISVIGGRESKQDGTLLELVRTDSNGSEKLLWNHFYLSLYPFSGRGMIADFFYSYSENLIYLCIAEKGNTSFGVVKINPNTSAKNIPKKTVADSYEIAPRPTEQEIERSKSESLSLNQQLIPFLIAIYELKISVTDGEIFVSTSDKYGKTKKLKYGNPEDWEIIESK